MTINMFPGVDLYELERAVILQYGENEYFSDLAPLLFGDQYYNDSYQSFDLEDDESDDPTPEAVARQCVRTYLKDLLPDYSQVLIFICW